MKTAFASRALHELAIGDTEAFDRMCDNHESMSNAGLDIILDAADDSTRTVHPLDPPRLSTPQRGGSSGDRYLLVPASLIRDALRLRQLQRDAMNWNRGAGVQGDADRDAAEIEQRLRAVCGEVGNAK